MCSFSPWSKMTLLPLFCSPRTQGEISRVNWVLFYVGWESGILNAERTPAEWMLFTADRADVLMMSAIKHSSGLLQITKQLSATCYIKAVSLNRQCCVWVRIILRFLYLIFFFSTWQAVPGIRGIVYRYTALSFSLRRCSEPHVVYQHSLLSLDFSSTRSTVSLVTVEEYLQDTFWLICIDCMKSDPVSDPLLILNHCALCKAIHQKLSVEIFCRRADPLKYCWQLQLYLCVSNEPELKISCLNPVQT